MLITMYVLLKLYLHYHLFDIYMYVFSNSDPLTKNKIYSVSSTYYIHKP